MPLANAAAENVLGTIGESPAPPVPRDERTPLITKPLILGAGSFTLLGLISLYLTYLFGSTVCWSIQLVPQGKHRFRSLDPIRSKLIS